ncbi:hypothetical protein [Methanogenium cariaci]|nr:hypothetical protein [Methanogenium cariaci]
MHEPVTRQRMSPPKDLMIVIVISLGSFMAGWTHHRQYRSALDSQGI